MAKIEEKKLSDFRTQEENANAHTERGLQALGDAYSEVGYVAPMTAAANGEMLDGNARLEKALDQFDDEALVIRHDGSKPVIMIREDVKDANDPKGKRISYGGNRIGEIDLAWDPVQVLADIDAGVDLSGLFDEIEIDELLAGLDTEPPGEPPEPLPPPIDKAEELQKKWQCETGQIWQIESRANPGRYHRLICGDCRDRETVEALLDGVKVNGIFTSPPYAMQRAKQYGGVEADQYVDWWEAVQANMRAVLTEDGSFFVNIKPHCSDGQRVLYVFDLVLAMVRRWGWRFVDELCWTRITSPGRWTNRFKNFFEPVFHFSVGVDCKFNPTNVLTKFKSDPSSYKTYNKETANKTRGSGFDTVGSMKSAYFEGALPSNVIDASGGASGDHFAIFPLKLSAFFIKAFSDKGDVWLEPFAGSGTVGCAAESEGRLAVLVEKLPKYNAVILERLQTHIGNEPQLINESV